MKQVFCFKVQNEKPKFGRNINIQCKIRVKTQSAISLHFIWIFVVEKQKRKVSTFIKRFSCQNITLLTQHFLEKNFVNCLTYIASIYMPFSVCWVLFWKKWNIEIFLRFSYLENDNAFIHNIVMQLSVI